MKSVVQHLAIAVFCLLAVAAPASAQYMYLDVNGDGVNTPTDILTPASTSVDVWLDLTANADGSSAFCVDDGVTPYDMVSYEFFLQSNNPITWGAWTDNLNFPIVLGAFQDATTAYRGQSGFAAIGSDRYKLGTLAISDVTDGTALSITGPQAINPFGFTSFGSSCLGFNSDNTMKLGDEWSDVAGTHGGVTQNANPVLSAPAGVTQSEGDTFSITANATDADASDVLTIAQTGAPGFLSFSHTPGVSPASATLSGTAGFSDAGNSTIDWTVDDGAGGTDAAATELTVLNVDRPVNLDPIADVTVAEGSTASRDVNASDADGDVIELTPTLPPFATLNATNGVGSISTTISFAPQSGDAGPYTGEVTAMSLGTTDTETFSITVTQTNQEPVLDPIADLTVQEGSTAFRSVNASDADGDQITLTATLPSFATLDAPTIGTASVATTITVTPGFSDAGTYPSSVTATDGLVSVTENFDIIVENLDRPVALDPIGDINVNEGSSASTGVSASDPDGETITLTASLPAFATLDAPTTGAGSVSTTVTASPASGDAGSYPSSVTASAGGATDTENFTINVGDVDQAPVLDPIADLDVQEGGTNTTAIHAADADGDLITLSPTGLPSFATLDAPTSGTGSVSTTVTASPASGDAGSYPVSVTATALALSDTQSFSIHVTEPNAPPTIDAPPTAAVDEGKNLNFLVTASDPNSDPLTVTMSGAASGASLTNNNDGTWTFDWTPGFSDAGVYTVTFTANDGRGGTNSAATEVTVTDVNRCPTAIAGGPYGGVINVPVSFDGTGSSDPDGDPLTYAWAFGDGADGSGPTPSHAYASEGTYTVTLTVGDGLCTGGDETTASIASEIAANAFTSGGNNTTRLWAGKPTTCVQIEPVNGSFQLSDVDFTTIRMASVGTGSVSEIFALSDKTSADGDRNHNGVNEIAACFSKDDLRLLFDGLPAGNNAVTVEIRGDLVGGGSFSATLDHRVLSRGGALAATITPNPLNPEGTLSFATARTGRVRVAVFDISGRLVRTLLDEIRAAGVHDVTWNGTRADGRRVASGVYFLRIQSAEGRVVRSVTVLK